MHIRTRLGGEYGLQEDLRSKRGSSRTTGGGRRSHPCPDRESFLAFLKRPDRGDSRPCVLAPARTARKPHPGSAGVEMRSTLQFLLSRSVFCFCRGHPKGDPLQLLAGPRNQRGQGADPDPGISPSPSQFPHIHLLTRVPRLVTPFTALPKM